MVGPFYVIAKKSQTDTKNLTKDIKQETGETGFIKTLTKKYIVVIVCRSWLCCCYNYQSQAALKSGEYVVLCHIHLP
jgi:hypothetical protein